MLPFLEPKKMTSVIIARRGKPDLETAPEVDMSQDKMDPAMKAAAEDVMRAIEGKSVHDLARALQSAFEICDSMPHEEGPHFEEEE